MLSTSPGLKQYAFPKHLSWKVGPRLDTGQFNGRWEQRAIVGDGGLTIPETGGDPYPWGPGFEKETGLRGLKQSEAQETESAGLGRHKAIGSQSVV